jgi:hypothetical protein
MNDDYSYVDRPSPVFGSHDVRRHTPEAYPPICFDQEHFLISRNNFELLPEYSTTRPTGVYDGKCWKIRRGESWWIGCYIEESPPHPDGLLTPVRLALIIN